MGAGPWCLPICFNYYTWIPGSTATFDEWEWAAYGGDEWTWDKCKAYLYKVGCALYLLGLIDTHHQPATYNDDQELFSPSLSYIGKDGPIPVSHSDLIPEIRPFRKALTEAWVSKGHPLTEDVHNGTMCGLWKSANSIYNGKWLSSWLYLVGKPNITVLGKTNSKKLIIENGHAVSVVVIREDGTEESYKAKAEVIVSSGVFETPKLLLLSGIGPAAMLKQFGIHQVVDSPHLRQNLLDHPILTHVFRLKDGYGLDHHLRVCHSTKHPQFRSH
jgi:choline dehydrogenase-like flavoprotein